MWYWPAYRVIWRTFSQIERRCRSVVPQQPPRIFTPWVLWSSDHRVRPLVDVVLSGLLAVFQLPVLDLS